MWRCSGGHRAVTSAAVTCRAVGSAAVSCFLLVRVMLLGLQSLPSVNIMASVYQLLLYIRLAPETL